MTDRLAEIAARLRKFAAELQPYQDTYDREAALLEDAAAHLESQAEQIARLEGERDAAVKAMDDVAAPDGEKSLAQRICDEFADFQMVIRHCSEIYDYVTEGQVSKPNTLPSVVKALADYATTKACEEAVKDETEPLLARAEAAEQRLARLEGTLRAWKDAREALWHAPARGAFAAMDKVRESEASLLAALAATPEAT